MKEKLDETVVMLAMDAVKKAAYDGAKRRAPWRPVLDISESPIEWLFGMAAWSVGTFSDCATMLEVGNREDLIAACSASSGHRIFFAQQISLGNYRVDFLFVAKCESGVTTLLAVECDGHEFHERSKEQAARDKSRDRELMSQGILVLRFTGSEIWADAVSCVNQVIAALQGAMARSAKRDSEA